MKSGILKLQILKFANFNHLNNRVELMKYPLNNHQTPRISLHETINKLLDKDKENPVLLNKFLILKLQ